MTRPEGTKEQLEERRKQAMNMLEHGIDPPEVAEIVGHRLPFYQKIHNQCCEAIPRR
jgi:hypothetical protein